MTPEQAKSARLTLQIGHMQICRKLGISVNSLLRAEHPNSRAPLSAPTLARLRKFYEAAGIDFKRES
jgi:transcriptional regulator with XRE-family HTH domain